MEANWSAKISRGSQLLKQKQRAGNADNEPTQTA
jgi:hypothetical protein